MKKYILILLLFTSFLQAQTYPVNPTPFGKIALKTNTVSTSTTKINTQESDGQINYIDAVNLPIPTSVLNVIKQKADLSTGLIKNGLISINADPTKFNISAGVGIISNFSDPDNPVSTIINFPAFTGITPTYLTTGNITYIAINSAPSIVMQASPFTASQRRDLIVLGAVVHSNLTNINVVNNIDAPSNAIGNQLHDFIEAVGALNITGNKYSANGANLSLNKSAGSIFKLGVNFANDWKNPHQLAQSAGTAITFRYRTQNGTEGSDRTALDPTTYDLNNVLTAVPNNKFIIETVIMFQSGLTRVLKGQNVYDDMATALAAISTREFVIEPNSKENGIVRAYIVMKNNTTSLQNATDARIVEAQKFGGVASGGVALTFSNIVSALGYIPANDISVLHNAGDEIKTGNLTATSFIKSDATVDQALVGDGSVRTLSDVQNGVVQSLQPYRINLSNFNNEKSLDLNTRKNLIVNSETYTTANNFFTANSATIDNNDIMYFQGIKMVKLKDANFFSNLNIRQTNLVIGKRYMFSYYVKSNVGEDFIFDDIGDSNQSGHRRRFIDYSVRRVYWIGQAISNTFLDKFLVPTTAMGSGTGSYATIGVSKTFTASAANPYGNMYIGGVQIEEIPDTYVDGVVWMGDSTIAGDAGLNNGYQNTAIPSLFSDIMNCSSFNKGVAGERLDQIDARWATSVTPLKNNSKYVIIQGGLNDIGQGTRTLADMQASINSMNSKALADGLIPIYLTCSPNDNFDATQETLRDNFNYWLLTTFVKVIDINNAIEFNSKLTQGFPRYVTDGIHYGLTLRKSVAGFIAKSPFFEFLKPTDYQATTATYTGKDLIAKNVSVEQITTTVAPTTSAGGYDLLTRNTATGVTEKVASGNFAIDANALHKTTNETFTGAKSAVNTGAFGVVNGLNLENSGTSDSRVINVLNSNTGIGTYLINSSSGTGSYDTNSSSGVLKIFESSTGSTGDLTRWTKNLVTKAKVDQNGEFTAQKYNLNTGSNSAVGNAVLVAGAINVTTTAATTNSIVILTRKTAGGTIGNLTYTTGVGGITINSDSLLDTSTVSYLIIN